MGQDKGRIRRPASYSVCCFSSRERGGSGGTGRVAVFACGRRRPEWQRKGRNGSQNQSFFCTASKQAPKTIKSELHGHCTQDRRSHSHQQASKAHFFLSSVWNSSGHLPTRFALKILPTRFALKILYCWIIVCHVILNSRLLDHDQSLTWLHASYASTVHTEFIQFTHTCFVCSSVKWSKNLW